MCTKTKFVETFIDNKAFICPNGRLLKVEGDELQHIDEHAWIRLITAVYYSKFKTFFRSKPISYTYDIIYKHSEARRMLSSVNYTPDTKRPPLATWHEFIHRVTYHVPKVTKQHELKVIPSFQALILHSKRANYVLKLAVTVTILSSPFLHCFEQFGWHTSDGTVEITWDNKDVAEADSCEENSDEELDSEAEPPVTEVEEQEQMEESDSDGAL